MDSDVSWEIQASDGLLIQSLRKKRRAQPRKYRIFLSPAGSSLAEELERSQSLDLPMELLTQELKDEVVRTLFDWAFLSTAVGLKTAAAFSANWK